MKLCYVLPKFDIDDTEHFAHVPHLLGAVAQLVPVALLIEKAENPPKIAGVTDVWVAGPLRGSRGVRAMRFARDAFRVSREGDVVFFLRYSRLATTILIVLRMFNSFEICYWMSGSAQVKFDPQGFRMRLAAKVQRLHTTWLLRKVDKVFTGPETMLTFMSEHWRVPQPKLRLVYNDIDTKRFRPAEPDEREQIRRSLGWGPSESIVLFVHHLSPRRGSRLLVPIVQGVATELPGGFRLVVVGDGPGMQELRSELDLYSLDGRIELKGRLPNRVLPDLYRAADCFLMPSFEEGFPRVVIEAMASGLPIVATDAGGTRDVLGADYPYCKPVGDIQGLVEGLQALLRSSSPRAQLGRSLRQRALDKFSTEQVSRMLVSELER